MPRRSRIPIIMFHSVNHRDPGWLWDELTCPVEVFARKLEALGARGYRPTTLGEIREIQAEEQQLRERKVLCCFDDGYLDNWVYVYPLLKRGGWKGVVYVNPEFVDPSSRPRPNLEDVWSGRCAESELQTVGFLNWAELEIMDASGIIEIASHSMTHTWYPIGPEIADFHRPGLDTPWLAWNARPDRKPYYRNEDQSGFVAWGTPIQRSGRSLGIRRYMPDPDVAAAAVAHVAARGGAAFFAREGWRDELGRVVREADRGRGRAESDEEMNLRFEFEVNTASRVLGDRLGRPVRDFCWPGGAYCEDAWRVVDAADMRTVTINRRDERRWNDKDPRFLRRVSECRQYSLFGRRRETDAAGLLPVACDVELARAGAGLELKLRKLIDTCTAEVRRRRRSARDAGGRSDGGF